MVQVSRAGKEELATYFNFVSGIVVDKDKVTLDFTLNGEPDANEMVEQIAKALKQPVGKLALTGGSNDASYQVSIKLSDLPKRSGIDTTVEDQVVRVLDELNAASLLSSSVDLQDEISKAAAKRYEHGRGLLSLTEDGAKLSVSSVRRRPVLALGV